MQWQNVLSRTWNDSKLPEDWKLAHIAPFYWKKEIVEGQLHTGSPYNKDL